MGLDMGIIATRKKVEEYPEANITFQEVLDNPFFTEKENFPDSIEMWYARKFWDMITAIPELSEIARSDEAYGRIKKDVVKRMTEFYATHPDFFDGFGTLPELCQTYQYYDELQAKGYSFYFYASY